MQKMFYDGHWHLKNTLLNVACYQLRYATSSQYTCSTQKQSHKIFRIISTVKSCKQFSSRCAVSGNVGWCMLWIITSVNRSILYILSVARYAALKRLRYINVAFSIYWLPQRHIGLDIAIISSTSGIQFSFRRFQQSRNSFSLLMF